MELDQSLLTKKIFIVGASRSGTTMMGRILARSPEIFTFNELHFFEELWNPDGDAELLSHDQAVEMTAHLLTIQRDGYYRQQALAPYYPEAEAIVQLLVEPLRATAVFANYLTYETHRAGRQLPCDQTPRNLLYLEEILAIYPGAYILIMLRDARDVMLSQKKRWQRRALSNNQMPMRESLRSWANYHPITMSMLWNNAVRIIDKYADHPRIYCQKYEDLLQDPEQNLRQICQFLQITYRDDFQMIPHIGSSHEQDQDQTFGLRIDAINRWHKDKNNRLDLTIAQHWTKQNLAKHGYQLATQYQINSVQYLWAFVSWVFKIGLAFLLNFSRTRNIVPAIRRRVGSRKS